MHIRLIPHYIVWHYTQGIKDYFSIAKRFLVAISILFSLRLMLGTFFEPFERLDEHYQRGSISAFFETFIVNSLMRMVGMVVRLCVLIIGIVAWLCGAIFSLAGIIVWLLLPLIVVCILYASLYNLIKAL